MFNSPATESSWISYKIPPTPDISNNSVYALTCENGAVSTKNPSQFLKWKLSIPNPPSGEGLYVLGAQNGVISWIATESCN